MSLDDIVRGIEIVLAVSAARQTDLHTRRRPDFVSPVVTTLRKRASDSELRHELIEQSETLH